MAAGALVVGVISAGVAIDQENKSQDAQKKAAKVSRRQADLQNAKQRRQQIAKSRRLRAQAIAQTEAGGVSGSSVQQGVVGSLKTQESSNISFLNQLQSLDKQRFSYEKKAQSFNKKAGTASAVSGLSFQAAGSGLLPEFK